MPELPEVETVTRGLREKISNQVIAEVQLRRPDLRRPFPKDLAQRCRNQRVVAVQRRAKFILIELENGTLLSHLGMSGSWREDDGHSKTHDHVIMVLANGRRMIYHDPRRFGVLDWSEKGHLQDNPWLKNLGPEPFDENNFTADYLKAVCRGRTAPIKNVIMDQKVVVGVGNIYASEALFLAGVRPQRRAARVTRLELDRLVHHTRHVLQRSIDSGGTTLRDYTSAEGRTGEFKASLKVYAREGETCRVCQTRIKSLVIGQRSSFYCPQCQK